MLGEQISHYRLVSKLGEGAYGVVFKGVHVRDEDFKVAIKVVQPSLIGEPKFVESLKAECLRLDRLEHAAIVRFRELVLEDDLVAMVLELLEGQDLHHTVSDGGLPIADAVRITEAALSGLAYAHGKDVVHRDIKPSNIFLCDDGRVKILDFGIARAAFQADTQHRIVRGKYAYMSPEQVSGKTLDGRSDLFSLGIVLYEMLTGRRLFKMKSRDETLARVRRAEVPSPRGYRPEISEDLEAFLLKVLSRNRDDRFEDGQQMYAALTRLMVREGHRSTNNDLAAHLKEVIEAAAAAARGVGTHPKIGSGRVVPPSAVVCMAIEAAAPPRSIAAPRATMAALGEEWATIVADANGEIWERGDGSMLVTWVASGGFRDAIARAVGASNKLQWAATDAGYRLSVGIAPGVVRIQPDNKRPSSGWELAGPFYLARWLMNFSAHRGCTLLTEVAARHVEGRTQLLGRIPIQGNRFINLYEMS